MNITQPPISNPLLETTGLATKPWILWFISLFTGDTGTPFVPVASNMVVAGTPTYEGTYYRSGQFIDFHIIITPSGGGSTTSTAGTTYFALPFDVTIDGMCSASTGNAAAMGGVEALNNRVYPPSWTTVATPITISGRVLGK